MHAIRTEALTKDFTTGFWRQRPVRALDRLSLTVERGEVFGFLGPNGAGKTTTIKLLMQLIFPTAGSAEILGKPVGTTSVKRRIGYLPETPYFYDNLTAEELLRYFASLFGFSAADRRQRTTRVLDQVGLGAERRMQLRQLSKGMLQRVGIAQALINDPEVLFLDEPLSGLDPLGRREIRSLIMTLRGEGRTVFFSSHILADAEAMCSQVGILVGGRLTAVGSLAELLSFERGWDLVVAEVAEGTLAHLKGKVRRVTRIADGRYTLELEPGQAPEQVLSQCVAHGGRLVSLSPLHGSLEDFFVQQVEHEAARRTG